MKLLKNTLIHTLNSAQPQADALLVGPGSPGYRQILAVGESAKLEAEYGHLAEIEDLGGKIILPGLTDAHIHLRHFANYLKSVDLFGTGKAAGLSKITAAAQDTPQGEWITAYGWSQDLWGGEIVPLAELDAVSPDHPVLLMGVSLHVIWANSAAMKAAGIDTSTPAPPKGVIKLNAEGQLTGLFYEDAMQLFNHVLPDPTSEDTLRLFERAQLELWKMGITGVHDFDRIPSFIALQTLHSQGRLKLRVLKNLPVESLDTFIESGLRSGFGDDLLRIGSIKAFADGALGARTAALLEPYNDDPSNLGLLLLDAEDLAEFGQKAVANGFGLTVHAIGDAANHQMLNGFEQIRAYEQAHGLPRRRHRIEHVQLLHPQDLDRLTALDLIASMQPIHATSDINMADLGWGERSWYAYAWRTLLDRNTRLAFGSDAPVASPNPFEGLFAAVTRRRPDGYPGPDGWYPGERISLREALKAYTHGAAYTAGMEDRLGMLAPGFLADLIVLEQDPFQVPPDELRQLKPAATMVGGEWVFRA